MRITTDGFSNGVLVYDDTRLPESYRGLIFASDGDHVVHAYKVERKGATFAVRAQFDLLESSDPLTSSRASRSSGRTAPSTSSIPAT